MYTPKKPEFKLADYPHEIARVRTAIARLDRDIADLEQAIDLIEVRIDSEIAGDPTLKNDTQRRARRGELRLSALDWQVNRDLLRAAQEKRTKEEIKLELLRSMFSVAKLQARQEIAALVAEADLALVA